VFCPDENTVDFRDIDNGKIFVISMPQRYSRERLFFNTFLKLLFSKHATFRFDNPQNYNLIAFVADEAQQVVTSSRHSSDHETVAVIREARATFILAAQSITSFAPKLKKEELEALVLNFANQIYFTVADQAAAEAASRIFGNHKVVEETKSTGRGSNSISRREVDKPVYSTAELRGLKKYQCVIRHPSGKHEKTYLPPLDERGKIPMFYYQDRYDFVAPFFYILQTK
jgi:type IV secretory pathway TraG/TraD family ATPase VirD4